MIVVRKPEVHRIYRTAAEGDAGKLSVVGGDPLDTQLLIPALAVSAVYAEVVILIGADRHMVDERRTNDVIVTETCLPASDVLSVDKVQRIGLRLLPTRWPREPSALHNHARSALVGVAGGDLL